MRAASLFLTLVCAHGLMLVGRPVPVSFWSLPAYLWQDIAAALLFALYAQLARRPLLVWPAYAFIVAYAALNVAVARVLPSPLTPAMLRAARGTLADSIAPYVTLANLGWCALVVAIGVVVPIVLCRFHFRGLPRRVSVPVMAAALALLVSGPMAVRQIDTQGWHRNAIGALLPGRQPVPGPDRPPRNWRQSPFASQEEAELQQFRGAARDRNVVLVILESVGAEYLRPYGAAVDAMPNLSRLASESLLFEAAYAVYPESIKGLVAVLCSRHPALGVPVERHAAAKCDSMAQILADAGYRTGLFHSGRFDYLGMRGVVEQRGFGTLADAGLLGGRQDSSFGIDEQSTVGAMLDWIDGREEGSPFFLIYLPIAGHHPYATMTPGPFAPVDDRSRYLNAIHEADAALGRLASGIADRGLESETLYVIFGDHSEAFGQHPGNIGHSFFLYDENVRVPFLIAAPGLFDNERRVGQVISIVDTAPTLLDLIGLPVPDSYEGRSALQGTPQMALFLTDYGRQLLGLVDGCRKLIYDLDSGAAELYHICRDTGERHNLASTELDRVSVYIERLEQWAAATRASMAGGGDKAGR